MSGDHPNVTVLKTELTDKDLAADIKRRLIEAYGPLLVVLQDADAAGFECAIQTGKDGLGRHCIAVLKVVKVY